MSVQIAVANQPTHAFAGTVNRCVKPLTLSRICDEAGGIGFGVFVVRSSDDRKVKLPSSAGELQTGLIGIAPADRTKQYNPVGYGLGEDLGFLLGGAVYVITEEPVTQGEAVYVRHTANGGNTQLGAARNDGDSGTCELVAGCKYLETTTAAGIALVIKNGW
jgi:hypothetical protein